MTVTKDKIRMSLSRAEAADRLAQIAQQLRDGSVSLGGPDFAVANDVELKAVAEHDKLEFEVKWRRA